MPFMKVHHHFALLSGLVTLTLLPRFAFPNYYTGERRAIEGQAAARRAREIEAGWKLPPYADMALPGTVDAVIAALRLQSLDLSRIQRSTLEKRVRDLLLYFQEPSVGRYYALKTRGFNYKFAPSKWATNLVGEIKLAEVASRGTLDTVCLLWDRVHGWKGNPTNHMASLVLPKITGISLQTVSGTLSHTNSGSALLAGPIQRGFTICMEAFNPGFTYLSGSSSQSPPLLFEFSFLVKANSTERCGPMYVSLLWIDDDQNWALNRLLIDSWLGFQTVF